MYTHAVLHTGAHVFRHTHAQTHLYRQTQTCRHLCRYIGPYPCTCAGMFWEVIACIATCRCRTSAGFDMPEKAVSTKEIDRVTNPIFNTFACFTELPKAQTCPRKKVCKRGGGRRKRERERERESEQDRDRQIQRQRHRERDHRAGNPSFRRARGIAG